MRPRYMGGGPNSLVKKPISNAFKRMCVDSIVQQWTASSCQSQDSRHQPQMLCGEQNSSLQKPNVRCATFVPLTITPHDQTSEYSWWMPWYQAEPGSYAVLPLGIGSTS